MSNQLVAEDQDDGEGGGGLGPHLGNSILELKVYHGQLASGNERLVSRGLIDGEFLVSALENLPTQTGLYADHFLLL